jgi:hypothetical protein
MKKKIIVKLKQSKNSLTNLPIGLEKENKKKNKLIERIKLKWRRMA